ncbi:AAA family ATPase [Aeromicrobium sp. JJY06]|uniref:AAA family ATPase n=1 Tax=Aeromicrobium sp. JJY06 TaxID=3373478 RepID=UPI00376EB600
MSRYFLTRVKIEGFRGINNEDQPLELRFKPESVNSVFAANASGKSSIFEALCFAIKGHVPKLRLLQAGEDPDRYVANLFHSRKTAVVELEIQDEGGVQSLIRVTRTPAGARVVDSPSGLGDPDRVLRSLNEDFTLLDYEEFTRFIDRTPLERGRSFASLLGLSAYSQLRQVLGTLSHTGNLNSDFDLPVLETQARGFERSASEAFARFRVAYEDLTGKSPSDKSDVAHWGAHIRQSLINIELLRPIIGERRLSELDFNSLREAVKSEEGGAKRDELAGLVELGLRLGTLTFEPLERAAKQAEELIEALRQRSDLLVVTPGNLYKRVHEAALHLYQSGEWHEPNVCVVCRSTFKEPLLPTIQAEAARFERVRSQEELIRGLTARLPWLQDLHRLEGLGELAVPASERTWEPLTDAAHRGTASSDMVAAALSQYEKLLERFNARIAEIAKRRADLERELPPSLVAVTTQIEHASQARDALTAYWRATNAQTTTRARLAKYEAWATYIRRVSEDLNEAEANLTAARLDAMGDQYKDLFHKIMGVGDVIPTLSRSDRGEQLDVRLEDFHGMPGLSARALLSESYRNALAISVFLSAAAQQKTASRFVVLDDVTSSFDAGHQWRLMDEIRLRLQHRPNADGLQFILLSHDGLLEKYFDKLSGGSDWHHQRLQGWPPLGAVWTVGQDANRVRQTAAGFLAAGQVKEAEPLIRQYLEFSLERVIRKVNIPVPFDFAIRDHMRMVGNSLDAIMAAVKLQRLAGGLVLSANQVADLETRHVPALVANWVSHYSTAVSASLSPPVLQGVLQAADDLSECFKYDDHSGTTVVRRWYRSLTSR